MGVEVPVQDTIAIVNVSGVFSVETAATIAQLLSEHPAVERRTPVLYDFSALDTNAIEPGELRRLAREPAGGTPSAVGPMAIVVASDLDFGMARMYATSADEGSARRRQVFRSRAEAWRWIVAQPNGAN